MKIEKLLILIVSILVFIPICALVYNKLSLIAIKKEVEKYKGDGEIRTLGQNFINTGYEITFGEVDFGDKFKGEYSLHNMPEFEKNDVGMYLNLSTTIPREYLERSSITIKLLDEECTMLIEMESILKDWWFGQNSTTYSIYNLDLSDQLAENLEPDKSYTLHIEYAPKEKSESPYKGYIELQAGGYY